MFVLCRKRPGLHLFWGAGRYRKSAYVRRQITRSMIFRNAKGLLSSAYFRTIALILASYTQALEAPLALTEDLLRKAGAFCSRYS